MLDFTFDLRRPGLLYGQRADRRRLRAQDGCAAARENRPKAEDESGLLMEAKKQAKGKALKISRQFAAPALSFIICFVCIFHNCAIPRFSALQDLDASAHLLTRDRLPYSIMPGAYSSRQEGASYRAVHLAATSALDFSVPKPSLARKTESTRERLTFSVLVDSGLEVRAPPPAPFFLTTP